MSTPDLDALVSRSYRHGFVTDIDADTVPPGLDESVVRLISRKKREPQFLLDWRLRAWRHWRGMREPHWAHLRYTPIDYKAISYYSAPKQKTDGPKSLADVDPKLLATYDRLGVPLHERARLAGVAVDAVFDSVSVATTFKEKLAAAGVIFCPFSEAVQRHPALLEQYLGTVVPYTDNFYATLNSAVFSDGSFVYVPPGVRCPMELSTYFRINAANTGQFERTLIIADAGSYVSYLEGCTAPMRDENQLHAAVVELIALEDAQIKYSTVQNWYPGDEQGRGGIYNFVTKRGECRGRNSHISWTQVETGSAITWKYPSCVLRGENSIGEFYSVATTNHYQQADTGTKMIHIGAEHAQHHRLQGHLGRTRPERLSRTGQDPALRHRRAQFHAVRFAAHGQALRRAHLSVHRSAQSQRHGRARGQHLAHQRRSAVLLPAARDRFGGCGQHDCQRILSLCIQGVTDGICCRSSESSGRDPRRRSGMNSSAAATAGSAAPPAKIPCWRCVICRSASADSSCCRGFPSRCGAGEVHAIMGPNGSGKSTLAYVLAGRPGYEIVSGSAHFQGRDLLALAPEERARAGLFLGFQYPVEIPGVNNAYLLKAALNAARRERGLSELDAFEFLSAGALQVAAHADR